MHNPAWSLSPRVALDTHAMRDRDGLNVRHRRFLTVLITPDTSHYLNGTRSYMCVYPASSYDAARSSACDLLARPDIQDAMAKAWTVEQMGGKLKKYVRKLEPDDPKGAAGVVMSYAELTGQLVRKSEVVQLTDEDQQMIQRLVDEKVKLILAQQRQPKAPPVVVEANGNDPVPVSSS